MPASPARSAAFEILLRVERDLAFATELLHSERTAKLSAVDHHLATEIVMGVLRWRSLLDERLASASSQKLARLDLEVLIALRIALYQVLFLSRIPKRAAIFESVELVKTARKASAAGFVNAVLRRVGALDRRQAHSAIIEAPTVIDLAHVSAHPKWLVARWADRYGFEAARQICRHGQTVPTTAIHANNPQTYDDLASAQIKIEPGLLVASARRIVDGDATKTEPYLAGRVAIQDEASQLVALLVGNGKTILDCCAAPGSKTRILAERNAGATIIAAELHPHRARLLRALVKLPNVRVLAADASSLPLNGGFDRILADVPCSGTGTLARNPEIKWRLKPENLADLQNLQISILKSALAQLAPGGRLVYSTCSLEPEENEAVVEAGLTPELKVVDCRGELEKLRNSGEIAWANLDSLLSGPYLRTIPGMHPCEGFFSAVIERS